MDKDEFLALCTKGKEETGNTGRIAMRSAKRRLGQADSGWVLVPNNPAAIARHKRQRQKPGTDPQPVLKVIKGEEK